MTVFLTVMSFFWFVHLSVTSRVLVSKSRHRKALERFLAWRSKFLWSYEVPASSVVRFSLSYGREHVLTMVRMLEHIIGVAISMGRQHLRLSKDGQPHERGR